MTSCAKNKITAKPSSQTYILTILSCSMYQDKQRKKDCLILKNLKLNFIEI